MRCRRAKTPWRLTRWSSAALTPSGASCASPMTPWSTRAKRPAPRLNSGCASARRRTSKPSMATDRLKIYNGALLICGERSLATLTENREPRRLLDQVWQEGGVQYCLEQGQWKFAMCASKFEADTSYTAQFGYTNRFQKP